MLDLTRVHVTLATLDPNVKTTTATALSMLCNPFVPQMVLAYSLMFVTALVGTMDQSVRRGIVMG